jgi:hypothetical protein
VFLPGEICALTVETAVRASTKEKQGAQKSAEAILAEPNHVLMPDRDVGNRAREGSREGLNIEPPERGKTCHVVKTDRWITGHPFWSKRASKQLI